jgi:hypothetical protein
MVFIAEAAASVAAVGEIEADLPYHELTLERMVIHSSKKSQAELLITFVKLRQGTQHSSRWLQSIS